MTYALVVDSAEVLPVMDELDKVLAEPFGADPLHPTAKDWGRDPAAQAGQRAMMDLVGPPPVPPSEGVR